MIELRADAATRDVIDVSDGIDRIMGDRELYGRMLARFRKDYQDGVGPIQRALDAGDMTLAHRLAHTLKGASGMIGAHILHDHACLVEFALRTNSGEHDGALATLAPEIEKVLQLLDKLLTGTLPTDIANHAVPTRPLLADAALMAQLLNLLENGDGAAIDLIEESGARLRVMVGDERLEQMVVAVNEFDFERALLALKTR